MVAAMLRLCHGQDSSVGRSMIWMVHSYYYQHSNHRTTHSATLAPPPCTMFATSSEPVSHNLKLQARCLAWVRSAAHDDADSIDLSEDGSGGESDGMAAGAAEETDRQLLLVGTTCLREDNQVCVCVYVCV